MNTMGMGFHFVMDPNWKHALRTSAAQIFEPMAERIRRTLGVQVRYFRSSSNQHYFFFLEIRYPNQVREAIIAGINFQINRQGQIRVTADISMEESGKILKSYGGHFWFHPSTSDLLGSLKKLSESLESDLNSDILVWTVLES